MPCSSTRPAAASEDRLGLSVGVAERRRGPAEPGRRGRRQARFDGLGAGEDHPVAEGVLPEGIADLATVLGGEDHPLLAERQGSRRLLVLINRDPAMRAFQLPAGKWTRICDSSARAPFASMPIDTDSLVSAYSVQVFEQDL